MDAFLITFREGLEAALAVAIVIGFLDRADRRDLRAWALAGIGAAIVASVAGAIALSVAGAGLENPLTEGVTYLAATVLVGSLVVWMLSHRTDAVARIREGLATRADGPAAGIAVAGFAFFLVAREGVETALFLGASAFGADPVAQVVGASLGIAAAVGLAVLLVRGIASVDLKTFFTVTAIALGVLAMKFLAGSVLGFSEVGLIPSSESTIATLELVAEGPVGLVLTLGAVAAPIVVVVAGLLRRGPATPAHSH
jgi:high-affinity iron transporter